jgi:3-hydroxyisobutyrate dehydrogenase-like beta-hydroxyacid dehydrogenase
MSSSFFNWLLARKRAMRRNQVSTLALRRSSENADKLIAAGMQWANTPRQVAEAAEITFSMVSDSHALEAIARGPNGIIAGLAPGKIHVDMSTVSPTISVCLFSCSLRMKASCSPKKDEFLANARSKRC